MPAIHQDWDPVVIHSKAFCKSQSHSQSNNPKPKIKYDENGDEVIPKRVEYTPSQINALQEARKLKNLTQADLAKQLNIDVKIINDIEARKSPYNRKLYSSLMRKLGVDMKSLKDLLI